MQYRRTFQSGRDINKETDLLEIKFFPYGIIKKVKVQILIQLFCIYFDFSNQLKMFKIVVYKEG